MSNPPWFGTIRLRTTFTTSFWIPFFDHHLGDKDFSGSCQCWEGFGSSHTGSGACELALPARKAGLEGPPETSRTLVNNVREFSHHRGQGDRALGTAA